MPTETRSSDTELISQAASAIEDLLANGTGAIAAGAWASLAAELRALSVNLAPQPHPEPIAWMVGTAFWWTKEEAERDAAAIGLPIVPVGPLVSIPDGYCLMPKRLTAENGAKALLLGEFKLEITQECPECRELDEPVEGCEICDGEGEYGQRHLIPWDKIKYIYSEAIRPSTPSPAATSPRPKGGCCSRC